GTTNLLTTSMKSVGEVMSFGRSFEEAMQKALRSLEKGLSGFDDVSLSPTNINTPPHIDQIRAALAVATPQRILYVAQAMRHGVSIDDIHALCKYDSWFLERIKSIVNTEDKIRTSGLPADDHEWLKLKKAGFSDARLAILAGVKEDKIRKLRHAHDIRPV